MINKIDISFININPTGKSNFNICLSLFSISLVSNIQGKSCLMQQQYIQVIFYYRYFSCEFPYITHAMNLVTSLKDGICTGPGLPLSDISTFLEWIESANPNAADLSEDKTNGNWGYSQFTAGSIWCAMVLQSWDQIGIVTACKLLTAVIKTCQVVWHAGLSVTYPHWQRKTRGWHVPVVNGASRPAEDSGRTPLATDRPTSHPLHMISESIKDRPGYFQLYH
jgi:hypothetical protein